jgi:hypothetical protein
LGRARCAKCPRRGVSSAVASACARPWCLSEERVVGLCANVFFPMAEGCSCAVVSAPSVDACSARDARAERGPWSETREEPVCLLV